MGFFHLVSPAEHFRYPPTPFLGVLNSIMSLILINQALGHLKMCFSGSRPTELPFIHPPPPPNGAQKWVFSPREPGRALQVPPPPILEVLNSIMILILINQALGHHKTRFSRSRPTEFPFIHPPPQTVPKMGLAGHFRYPPPYFGGAEFNYEPNSHQPSAGTSQNVFFRVQTDRISVYPPPPPPNGAENGFFHLVSPAGHFRYPPPLFWGC